MSVCVFIAVRNLDLMESLLAEKRDRTYPDAAEDVQGKRVL